LTRTLEWPGVELTVRTTTAGGVAATTQESYRLSPFHHGGWATNRPRVTHYTGASADFDLRYDARSNLVAEGTTSFQYNEEGNRLQAIDPDGGTPTAYAYDAAGFATSRGGVEITWQANGLMASHGLDRFEWDVLGRPISATVDGTTTRSGFGGSVTTDDAGVPIRVDLEEVSIDLQGGGRLYRHLDFRGNVKFTSDDAGATRSHYRYSPFGLEEIFGATDDPLRFAARPEIGDLMLMGARIYDPAAGRFLSPDPVFQVVNQYAYTLGNPVQFHDRSGRAALDQAGAAAPGLTTTQTLAVVGNAFLLAAAISALTGNMPLAATLGLTGMILVIMGSMDMGRRTRRRKDRRVLRFA
jgi:RHS repeat-associated protein